MCIRLAFDTLSDDVMGCVLMVTIPRGNCIWTWCSTLINTNTVQLPHWLLEELQVVLLKLKLLKWSRSEQFSILTGICPLPYFDPTFDRFFSEDCSRGGNQTAEARHRQVNRGQLAADEGVPISREKISWWISHVELDGLNCKDEFSDDSKILMLVRCIP